MTLNLLGLAADRLVYLAQSQSVLAGNIANTDTPGYVPKAPVAFSNVLNGGGNLAMVTTSANDIPSPAGQSFSTRIATVAAKSPDGNGVSLESQLAAIAGNQINQQYAVNIYKTYLGMFTTALGPNP